LPIRPIARSRIAAAGQATTEQKIAVLLARAASTRAGINGREAMPDGGNLVIEAQKTPSNVEVIVADEGTGIAEEVLEKIFDPFFTTKEMGTGLGLSMARDVMTRLDGKIRAENRSPQGAAIILNFPIAE